MSEVTTTTRAPLNSSSSSSPSSDDTGSRGGPEAAATTTTTHTKPKAQNYPSKCTGGGNAKTTQLLMESLRAFFEEGERFQHFFDATMSDERISLRVIDFFVTNYCRDNRISYTHSRGNAFIVHDSYKSQLKAYSKKAFDPFCRRTRISFSCGKPNSVTIQTTIGQLNFFRWAIENDVIQYIRDNMASIEHHMRHHNRMASAAAADDDDATAAAADGSGGDRKGKTRHDKSSGAGGGKENATRRRRNCDLTKKRTICKHRLTTEVAFG